MTVGRIEQLTVPPTLYPDDASVLRAQIKKLVQENQRLEREVERLNKQIADIKAACWEGKQQGQ
jgi:cell division protein FtsB